MTCIVAKIAYGYSIKNDNDTFAILIDKLGEMLHNSGPPASTPVDFFPWRECIVRIPAAHYWPTSSILVANFPSWFPGTYYAEYARKWRSLTHQFINYPFNFTSKQFVCMLFRLLSELSCLISRKSEGKAQPSFVSKHISNMEAEDIEDQEDYIEDIKGAAAILYAAGVETVSCNNYTWSRG